MPVKTDKFIISSQIAVMDHQGNIIINRIQEVEVRNLERHLSKQKLVKSKTGISTEEEYQIINSSRALTIQIQLFITKILKEKRDLLKLDNTLFPKLKNIQLKFISSQKLLILKDVNQK